MSNPNSPSPLDSKEQHWSDCATNNEPAEPNGECDCGGISEAYLKAQVELKHMDEKELQILKSHIDIELRNPHKIPLPQETSEKDWEKELGKFWDRVVSEEGRSQSFISSKHFIELTDFIQKLLSSQEARVRKEVIEEILDWIKNECGRMYINDEKWVSLNEIKLHFRIDEFKNLKSLQEQEEEK